MGSPSVVLFCQAVQNFMYPGPNPGNLFPNQYGPPSELLHGSFPDTFSN